MGHSGLGVGVDVTLLILWQLNKRTPIFHRGSEHPKLVIKRHSVFATIFWSARHSRTQISLEVRDTLLQKLLRDWPAPASHNRGCSHWFVTAREREHWFLQHFSHLWLQLGLPTLNSANSLSCDTSQRRTPFPRGPKDWKPRVLPEIDIGKREWSFQARMEQGPVCGSFSRSRLKYSREKHEVFKRSSENVFLKMRVPRVRDRLKHCDLNSSGASPRTTLKGLGAPALKTLTFLN